jgi:hypothetical protein
MRHNRDSRGFRAGALLAAFIASLAGGANLIVAQVCDPVERTELISPDSMAFDYFGSSAAISGDTAVIGAPLGFRDGFARGFADVFVRNGAIWTYQSTLGVFGGGIDVRFGCSVAACGDTVVVGAYGFVSCSEIMYQGE